MPTLTITRGLPASGKSTRARAWVAEHPQHRAEVNRDSIRLMLHGGFADAERQVTAVRDSAIRVLLGRGVDVVCSDTNLPTRHARELRRLAQLAGADFDVWDMTDVPVETCIERDAARGASVGEKVIRDFYARYVSSKPYPLSLPDESEIHDEPGAVQPYVPKPGTKPAVLVDIDGTVALKGNRSPYDESLVHEDRPNLPVIAAVRAMREAGYVVIFCSGRTEACRGATKEWLNQHLGLPSYGLHMRAVGDMRKDAVVKLEIFDREIRDCWHVVGVFDDRRQVVDMWRSLGLTVFQVAEGNF